MGFIKCVEMVRKKENFFDEEKVGVKGRGREMRMVRRWCGMWDENCEEGGGW